MKIIINQFDAEFVVSAINDAEAEFDLAAAQELTEKLAKIIAERKNKDSAYEITEEQPDSSVIKVRDEYIEVRLDKYQPASDIGYASATYHLVYSRGESSDPKSDIRSQIYPICQIAEKAFNETIGRPYGLFAWHTEIMRDWYVRADDGKIFLTSLK